MKIRKNQTDPDPTSQKYPDPYHCRKVHFYLDMSFIKTTLNSEFKNIVIAESCHLLGELKEQNISTIEIILCKMKILNSKRLKNTLHC